MNKLVIITSFMLIFFSSKNSFAENGVTDTEITLGMTNALTGPAQALGNGVKEGVQVYLDKINKSGGVHGRKIKIVSYDDGYEPRNTIKMTKRLIHDDKVFALFQYVGTPTSKAAVPIAKKNKIPYISPFTGAEFLRNKSNKHVFNVRASYFNETEDLVNFFVKNGAKKIAIFIQDDGYGNAGRAGVMKALKKRNMKLAGEGRYKRNTVNIERGLEKLSNVQPDAVIMIGAYKATGKAVREMRKSSAFKNTQIANISFVGTKNLIQETGKMGENTFISQVMPSPTMSNIAIIAQYRKDMAAAGKDPAYTSLEGYINAIVLVEVLKQTGKDLTRENFTKTFSTFNKNIQGMAFKNSPSLHQALSETYLTKIVNGQAKPVQWESAIGH